MTRQTLALRVVIRDSRIQPREAINLTTVSEYAQAMAKLPLYEEAGLPIEPFPPITVFHERDEEGREFYWLADGWHRVLAAGEAGLSDIDAEVREGGVTDAIFYAAGSNAAHGLKRTNRDKHRAVRMLLDHPTIIREEWGNARIAHASGVSDLLVRTVRRERETELGLPPSTERRGSDGKLYSLQIRTEKTSTVSSASKSATEPGLTTGVAPESSSDDSEVLLYQCGTEGCSAVLSEASRHCNDCGRHLPVIDYPIGTACPVCSDDPRARTTDVLASLESVELPKKDNNGITQAPYTPGIMKPDGTTLAYERLVAALGLIDSLAEYRSSDILSETRDTMQLLRRLRGAVTTLQGMVESYSTAGAAR